MHLRDGHVSRSSYARMTMHKHPVASALKAQADRVHAFCSSHNVVQNAHLVACQLQRHLIHGSDVHDLQHRIIADQQAQSTISGGWGCSVHQDNIRLGGDTHMC